jgi:hypothetical protein
MKNLLLLFAAWKIFAGVPLLLHGDQLNSTTFTAKHITNLEITALRLIY